MVSPEILSEDEEGVPTEQSDNVALNSCRQLTQQINDWLETAEDHKSYNAINNFYGQVSVELKRFANMKVQTKENEIDYLRLHMIRETLIQSAQNLEIHQLEDIRDKLQFWYKIVVSESTEDDLDVTDQFIIAIHKYLSSSTALSST
jgi:hypothetical protein